MGLQVLIVDDSATMRSILKKVVSLSGYEVGDYLECANGAEALEALAQNWVDVILLDVHMPVMDGITMLKHLSEDEVCSKTPVILVTTEVSQEAIGEAYRLGAKAHVKKPFQPESIRDVLKQVLGDEYARADEPDAEGLDF